MVEAAVSAHDKLVARVNEIRYRKRRSHIRIDTVAMSLG